MEKQFIQLQLSLFFKSGFTQTIEDVSKKIKEEFGEEMITQILGIPENAPLEIPRLIGNSKSVNINLAKNRINFFSMEDNFLENNLEKIWNIVDFTSVKIGRFGFVLTFFKEDAYENLYNIFDKVKIGTSFKPKEIIVRFNNEENLTIGKVNNSQIYEIGSIKKEDETKNGVIITRDINTLLEDFNNKNFTKLDLEKFISEAFSLTKKILI